MVSKDEIVNALHDLLKTSDMNTATVGKLMAKLQSTLGIPMAEHKELVKKEIDAYLSTLREVDSSIGDAPEQDRKRDATLAFEEEVLCTVPLSARRQARVKEYKGTLFLDVREFRGSLPTAKGIMLNQAQVSALSEGGGALSDALQAADTECTVSLSSKRVARISKYNGALSVDIREMYDKDGEVIPGKKGIALNYSEWNALLTTLPELLQHLHGDKNSQETQQQPTNKRAKSPKSKPQTGEDDDRLMPHDEHIELSRTRRAEVTLYRDMQYVNIREYYEKDGEWKPGQKGIALTPQQFHVLLDNADTIQEALAERNEQYILQLAPKRHVGLSSFRGQYLVHIREYYEKDGKQLPGKKGISLTEEQWNNLRGGLPALQAKLA